LLAKIAGSNSAGGMDVCLAIVLCYQVEVSATGLFRGSRGLLTSGVRVRVCVCVCVCVSLSAIRPNSNPLHLRRGKTTKESKDPTIERL
jgi:hypothetical protein